MSMQQTSLPVLCRQAKAAFGRVSLCALVALGAAPALAASPVSLHEHSVAGPLQWINGNYESPKRSAECVALQAKLVKNIASLKISNVWRDVSGSDSYKSFSEAHDSLKSAECHKAAEATQKDACVALTEKVSQQASALSETTQWKSLTASKEYKQLFGDIGKARKMGCVKPTNEPQGMK